MSVDLGTSDGKGAGQCGFDALKRRDGQQGLGDTGTKSGNHRPWTGYVTLGILEEGLVGVECNESDAGLEGVSDDESGAARIPRLTERRPGELLAVW